MASGEEIDVEIRNKEHDDLSLGLEETARIRASSPKGKAYALMLEKIFPFQGYIEKAEYRAITLKQLQAVLDYVARSCHLWHDTASPQKSWTAGQQLTLDIANLHHLSEWLIKPATLSSGCAFVELLTKIGQEPKWYVSHWWGEPFPKFVACVKQHVLLRGSHRDAAFWVCAYANRQHSLEQELAIDPKDTSFFKAMALAKGVLLILDGKTEHTGPATPFSRIWCAFEEYIALEHYNREGMPSMLLDIATSCEGNVHFLTRDATHQDRLKHPHDEEYAKAQREAQFPLDVIKEGLVLELEKAQASEEQDRVHILNCIAGRKLQAQPLDKHENYARANKRLRSFFAEVAWRQAADKGSVVELNLPQVLMADIWRESLTLDFSCCGGRLDDDSLDDLAKALSPNLRSLSLTFAYCDSITSDGVECLARRLPMGLHTLVLDFTGCHKVDDAAVASLLRHRPPRLQTSSSMAVFQGTGVVNFNTLWDFSCENVKSGLCANLKQPPASPTSVRPAHQEKAESRASDEEPPSSPSLSSKRKGKVSPSTSNPNSPTSPHLRDFWSQAPCCWAEQLDGTNADVSRTTPKRHMTKTSGAIWGSPHGDGALDTIVRWCEPQSPMHPPLKARTRSIHTCSSPSQLLQRRASSLSSLGSSLGETAQQRKASAFLVKLTESEQRADDVVKRCSSVMDGLRSKREPMSPPVRPAKSRIIMDQVADRLATRTKQEIKGWSATEIEPVRREGGGPLHGDARAAPLLTAARELKRRLRAASQA